MAVRYRTDDSTLQFTEPCRKKTDIRSKNLVVKTVKLGIQVLQAKLNDTFFNVAAIKKTGLFLALKNHAKIVVAVFPNKVSQQCFQYFSAIPEF